MRPRLEIHFTLDQQHAFLSGHSFHCPENWFLLNHARSGILLALKSLHLPRGSKVGVMAYNCHTVFNAVSQSGNRPVFVDVSENMTVDLDDLEKKRDGLSALVITHLFGIQNDIREIRRRFPTIPIIEDCAHVFGLKDLVGDFAVFSIGQGKLPSLGDGGILVVNNSGFQDEVMHLYQDLPSYGIAANAKLFFSLWMKSLLYRPGVYSTLTVHMKKNRKITNGIETIDLKKMSIGIQSMLDKVFASINGIIEKRKENALSRARQIRNLPGVRSVQCGLNAFMLVVICDHPKVLHDVFVKEGIETETHFRHCLDWARSFGYLPGECKGVENMIRHLLMVPIY